MASIEYRTSQGDTLDQICFTYYGTTKGTVEKVLEANAGLCELGVILPVGTKITLPDVEAETTSDQEGPWV